MMTSPPLKSWPKYDEGFPRILTPTRPHHETQQVHRKGDNRNSQGTTGWGKFANLTPKCDVSELSICGWQAKYSGMDVSKDK